jgi:hypothetical protein
MFTRSPHMPNDLQNVGKILESLQTVNATTSDKPSGHGSSTTKNPPLVHIWQKSDTDPCPEDVKCSRCRETAKFILQSGRFAMFDYSLNLWYCSRCATLVAGHQSAKPSAQEINDAFDIVPPKRLPDPRIPRLDRCPVVGVYAMTNSLVKIACSRDLARLDSQNMQMRSNAGHRCKSTGIVAARC